jgi:hypothetical protein
MVQATSYSLLINTYPTTGKSPELLVLTATVGIFAATLRQDMICCSGNDILIMMYHSDVRDS